jgi:hypothetical protein
LTALLTESANAARLVRREGWRLRRTQARGGVEEGQSGDDRRDEISSRSHGLPDSRVGTVVETAIRKHADMDFKGTRRLLAAPLAEAFSYGFVRSPLAHITFGLDGLLRRLA